MVVVLLTFFKNSTHGCRMVGTFKIKILDIVVVLLEFLSNMANIRLALSKGQTYSFKPTGTFKRPDYGSKPAGTF